MLLIRDMTPADEQTVMDMVDIFYHSPAVEHPVEREVLLRSFRAAADPSQPLLRGLLLEEDGAAVGYCYLTECYSAEAGGRQIIVEELYLDEGCRGKGYGTRVFRWIIDAYPEHVRFRLEVSGANRAAARLYERLGFRYLEYGQMVFDRI